MKESNSKIISILFLWFALALSCQNEGSNFKKQEDSFEFETFVRFNKNIEDKLVEYISKIPDTCAVLLISDRSNEKNIFRLNAIAIENEVNDSCFNLFTKINNRKVFIKTGIEDVLASNPKYNIINCGQFFFVLYDSANVISVIENFNDFDDNFSPNQSLGFEQIIKE